MTSPAVTDTLDELKRLMAEAAPAPWTAGPWGDGSTAPDAANLCAPQVEATLAIDMFKADAALIAAMRNKLPALIAVAEKAEEVCQKLESETASVTAIDQLGLRTALLALNGDSNG